MVILKVLLFTQPHYPQGRTDRAFAGGEQRADNEHFSMFPNALGKQWSKLYNQACQLERQFQPIRPLLAEWSLAYTAFCFSFIDP